MDEEKPKERVWPERVIWGGPVPADDPMFGDDWQVYLNAGDQANKDDLPFPMSPERKAEVLEDMAAYAKVLLTEGDEAFEKEWEKRRTRKAPET